MNLTLIGMPFSGKSTLGKIYAKKHHLSFIDTDTLIETKYNASLQEIIDNEGLPSFARKEENILLELNASNSLIATGGSAIYYERAMQNLRQRSIVVFLNITLATLQERTHNLHSRGIVIKPNSSLEELFFERQKLYLKYSHITIDNTNMEECLEKLNKLNLHQTYH